MKNIRINLFDKETQHGFMPSMTGYILDRSVHDGGCSRPAVLVIPGGGYRYVEEAEGERVALSFSAVGFHAFVLDYCVAPHMHPMPLLCAAKAVETIRENAEEWNINPEMIAVCGFSAGGHLAASLCTLWNDSEVFGTAIEVNKKHKPNASVLCYPVITCGEHSHRPSADRICGTETENELTAKLSLENRVSKDTTPAFIWHTFSDSAVPVENSLLYAGALRKSGVSFELHIYPDGDHGLVLGTDLINWGVDRFTRSYPWLKQAIEWLYLQFGITKIER